MATLLKIIKPDGNIIEFDDDPPIPPVGGNLRVTNLDLRVKDVIYHYGDHYHDGTHVYLFTEAR